MQLDTKFDWIVANKGKKNQKGTQGFLQIVPTKDYQEYYEYLGKCKLYLTKEKRRVRLLLNKRKDK